jgi:hypothetical protein
MAELFSKQELEQVAREFAVRQPEIVREAEAEAKAFRQSMTDQVQNQIDKRSKTSTVRLRSRS